MKEFLCVKKLKDVDIIINGNGLSIGNIPLEEYLIGLFTGKHKIKLAPWNKLFRRKLFSAHTFDFSRNIVIGEDMLMNIRLAFSCIKNVATFNNPHIYNYRLNEGSITNSFKSTPEYEHLFQKHLIDSIPIESKKKYFIYTIENRLTNFHRFWGYKYCVKGMKDSMFYKELKSDIEEYEYRLPILDRILFYNDNSFVRFIAIKAKCFQRKFFKKR